VTADLYQRLRRETAVLLHLDIDNLSPAEALKLDLTATLRIAFDDLLGQQMSGQPINLEKLLALAEKLEHLLPLPEEARPQRDDARMKLQALIDGARAAREYDVERGVCSECERLAAENTALRSMLNFARAGSRHPDQPPPEQPAAASPTPPSELLPPSPPPSTLAPWHGGPPSQSPWNSQPPQPSAPPSGPNRHYQEGSSSDFRDFIDPSGLIRSTPRGVLP
jgi:hypothetical protein